jgi:hypothetical protein
LAAEWTFDYSKENEVLVFKQNMRKCFFLKIDELLQNDEKARQNLNLFRSTNHVIRRRRISNQRKENKEMSPRISGGFFSIKLKEKNNRLEIIVNANPVIKMYLNILT